MENIGQSFFIQFRVLSVSQEPTFLQENFKLQLSVLIMYYDVECSLFPYDFPAVYFFETLESAKHFPVFFIYGLHHLHVGIAWQ